MKREVMKNINSFIYLTSTTNGFDACTDAGVLKVFKIVLTLINILKILVPIFLILTSTISLTKAVINADDTDIKTSTNLFITKFIIGAFIFFIPNVFINIFKYVNTFNYNNIIICITNSQNIPYYEQLAKVKKQQQLLEEENKRKKLLEQYNALVESYDNNTSNEGSTIGKKYNLSESDLLFLTKVAVCEQGTIEGVKAEASLMANRYELFGSSYSSLRNYVQNSGWFACARYTSRTSASNKNISAVKSVLNLGARTLALYVDEHDCINCNGSLCSNGNRGDICRLVTNGTTITSMSSIKNHNSYKRNQTVIYNKYSSVYTFYTFPCSSCDPFGYTNNAKNKFNRLNGG